jgi:hypothetical protein
MHKEKNAPLQRDFYQILSSNSHLVTESNFELQEIEDDDNIDENKLVKDREREREMWNLDSLRS